MTVGFSLERVDTLNVEVRQCARSVDCNSSGEKVVDYGERERERERERASLESHAWRDKRGGCESDGCDGKQRRSVWRQS